MPFELKLHPDFTTGLVATCDVCGSPATAGHANLLWLPKRPGTPGDTHPFFIACKGECDDTLEQKHGHLASQELETAIGYLINNTKTDVERARDTMSMLSRLS